MSKDEMLTLSGKVSRKLAEEVSEQEGEIEILRLRLAELRILVTKLHAAKGRYHTQLAACDLFDAVGLKNERPAK